MRASEVQDSVTIDEMFSLMQELGAAPIKNNDNELLLKSICHGDDRYKLYYYDNSKRFTCYTNCGSGFSIFDLIQKVKGVDFITSLNMIKDKMDITGVSLPINQMPDMSFFDKFNGKSTTTDYGVIDHKVMNQFNNIYHKSWIDDGISIESMYKYNIRFNIIHNQIIIPHYNISNELIGIRVRNLSKKDLEDGRKYMPLYYCGNEYAHRLGGNLYGLNFVEANVREQKKIIIFESEKACMQLETMFPNNNVAVALSGSSLTNEQAAIINELDVSEVIIALDKEYEDIGSQDELEYARQIRRSFLSKLLAFHKVSIIWDKNNLLKEKESPSDRGKEVFQQLYEDRIVISE